MSIKYMKNKVIGFLVIGLLVGLHSQTGSCGPPPKVGDTLPEMSLDAPVSKQDRAYLGIADTPQFLIEDIDTRVLVLEILGVYCPVCYKQRPHINRLFHRVNKNADLAGRVKFLGITAGGTPMETAYYIKQSKVPYPILPDENFAIHKKLNEPLTPCTLVATQDGRILYSHLGLIEDMDKFFNTLREMADTAPPVRK